MHTIMCETFSPSLRKRMKTTIPSSSTPETERTMVAPCVVGWNRRTERERPKPVENGWHVQSDSLNRAQVLKPSNGCIARTVIHSGGKDAKGCVLKGDGGGVGRHSHAVGPLPAAHHGDHAQVVVEHDEVGVLSDFQAADAVVEAEGARG